MFSIQQLIKAFRKLQANGASGDLAKSLKYAAVAGGNNKQQQSRIEASVLMTSLITAHDMTSPPTTTMLSQTETESPKQQQQKISSSQQHEQQQEQQYIIAEVENEKISTSQNSYKLAANIVSNHSHLDESSSHLLNTTSAAIAQDQEITTTTTATITTPTHLYNRSQQIQNFYQQQLHQFHTQHNQILCAKQKQTQFSMSSLAAEPLTIKTEDVATMNDGGNAAKMNGTEAKSTLSSSDSTSSSASDSSKPCFKTGYAEILKFMELIGNLKHTKRTGWVLRDVNDCESISGHMYRMSMMTFLLDGTEGLNQIRCMELALVHDLAESLVGDITPFCGVSKEDKRAMEFKAMDDICKLIEPRGNRIMELFEEYEEGESAESKFVKDLDRLDMVMQAFEYEKRDNCLLKHQEFFDSTEGKFRHPFVKKLVNEIYEQRNVLAMEKGVASNGHSAAADPSEKSTSSSSS